MQDCHFHGDFFATLDPQLIDRQYRHPIVLVIKGRGGNHVPLQHRPGRYRRAVVQFGSLYRLRPEEVAGLRLRGIDGLLHGGQNTGDLDSP